MGGVYQSGRSYLGLASAVKDVNESSSQLLLGSQADGGLQGGAEQQVVGTDVFGELFVLLHGQDDDTLVPCFDPNCWNR